MGAAKETGRWGFDLESNGLLDTITTIHCIVCREMDTDEVKSFGPDDISSALYLLMNAKEVMGHNIIAFDIPAIQKIYPDFTIQGKITDTLVLSRLMKTTLYEDDVKTAFKAQNIEFPRTLYGSHGLKAWGLRLSDHKASFTLGWVFYNEEMLKYCQQDTQTTQVLYDHLMTLGFSQQSIDLEHSLATICLRIGNNGWTFDRDKAAVLYAELCQKREEIASGLDALFEPWEVTEDFYPKSNNATRGYVKGELFVKSKTVYFNPGSRRHIEHCLRLKYNWTPQKYTQTGHAQIDESVLGGLDYPEAQQLATYFLIQKRLGQLAEGPMAWMKRCDDDGRLRHTIVSGGTISGRAAHRSPNLAQVPKGNLLYGKECRQLFSAPLGWTLLGVDLSGLELRMLAHFLDDGGQYADQILNSDIHTHNQVAAGLSSRDESKRFIYSLLFGAGDSLIGTIVGGSAKEGKKLKASFNKNVPAFAKLQSNLLHANQRGYLNGLDGRRLFIREDRKLLSQLLQSSGALVCKKWVELTDTAINQKYTSDQVIIQGWIHDEMQIGCATKEVAEDVLKIAISMAGSAGRHFSTTIPIDASGNMGETWHDSH